MATARAEGLSSEGPFFGTTEYFAAIADGTIGKLCLSDTDSDGGLPFATLGSFVFRDIVHNTTLFQDSGIEGQFPLNHMDLGTQNILVDDQFNFLAIIDWEFCQTSPWQVNHYPMPFPLSESDAAVKLILQDPDHLAQKNVARQDAARRLYVEKFRDAEIDLRKKGRPLGGSFAEVLDSPASRVYGCFTRLGDLPESDKGLVHEMLRLAFRFDAKEAEQYLHDMEGNSKRADKKVEAA